MCHINENREQKLQRENPSFAELMADYWASKRRNRVESTLNFDDLIMSSCELPTEKKEPIPLDYIGTLKDSRISEEDHSDYAQDNDRDNITLK